MFKVGQKYRYTGGLTNGKLVVKVTELLPEGKAKGVSVGDSSFGMTHMTQEKWTKES